MIRHCESRTADGVGKQHCSIAGPAYDVVTVMSNGRRTIVTPACFTHGQQLVLLCKQTTQTADTELVRHEEQR